jgi:hypothetical protein
VEFSRFVAVARGEICGEISMIFLKEGNKRKRNFADLSPQTSPHGHKRTLTQNNFETNSAGKLSLANFARKSSQFYSLYKSTNWQGVQ